MWTNKFDQKWRDVNPITVPLILNLVVEKLSYVNLGWGAAPRLFHQCSQRLHQLLSPAASPSSRNFNTHPPLSPCLGSSVPSHLHYATSLTLALPPSLPHPFILSSSSFSLPTSLIPSSFPPSLYPSLHPPSLPHPFISASFYLHAYLKKIIP